MYRADIDGLRALAVSAVIAFHLAPHALPGGYLGVDMFFVLSGFLITSIIWSEIQSGNFSLAQFYERRLRRIMPALLIVLIATSVLSLFILLPADLTGYGKSLLATLGFVANIYFWRDTNYFARAAEEKPLLHIWSLGVEEQFYFLFPLILIAVAHFRRSATLLVVLFLTLASLMLNVVLIKVGGANPAFFLLPSRAWELGFGATLALLPLYTKLAQTRVIVATSAAGMGLIIFALSSRYPIHELLPAALPAVIGTGLLIWCGANASQSPVNSALSMQPAVFLGKISYSLYLWHWPIIVFMRYYLVRELTLQEILLALTLMIALAVLTWKFVEEPFRRRLSFKWIGSFTLTSSLLIGAFATSLILMNGFPSRLPADAARINEAVGTNYRCPVQNYLPFGSSRACILNLTSRNPQDASVVLFGNSHAQMYAPLVEVILQERKLSGLLVPMNGCLPTISVNTAPVCREMAKENLAEIMKLPNLHTIVVGLTWQHDKYGLTDKNGMKIPKDQEEKYLIAGLDEMIAEIEKNGKNVIVIGPIAYPGWDLASILSRKRAFGWQQDEEVSIGQERFLARHGDAVSHFDAKMGATFIPAHSIQCDGKICNFLLDGRSLFADSNHLAAAELSRWREVFDLAFDSAQNSK